MMPYGKRASKGTPMIAEGLACVCRGWGVIEWSWASLEVELDVEVRSAGGTNWLGLGNAATPSASFRRAASFRQQQRLANTLSHPAAIIFSVAQPGTFVWTTSNPLQRPGCAPLIVPAAIHRRRTEPNILHVLSHHETPHRDTEATSRLRNTHLPSPRRAPDARTTRSPHA